MPRRVRDPESPSKLTPSFAGLANHPTTRLRYLEAAPELLAVGFTGFCVAPMILLLVGHFSAGLVLPLGAVGAGVALATLRLPTPGVSTTSEPTAGVPNTVIPRRDAILSGIAVVIALSWIIANLGFSSENMYAIRDPATYNLAARWLMDHHSLVIRTHPEVFGSLPGADATSAGFGSTNQPAVLYAQGNHLLPALMAIAGWVFGVGGLLKANIVLAGAALLVFFGLARRVVGSAFALVAMTALGVSMPMLFVGRDSYTEPLALLFLMGGLSLLHRALLSRRVLDFAGAGFVAGMSGAVRIDSYASVLSLIGVSIVVAAVSPPERRVRTLKQIGAFLGSGALTMYLGWLDVTLLSSGYYHDQRSHIVQLVYAAVALLVLGPVVVAVAWTRNIWTHHATRIILSPNLRNHSATIGSATLVLFALLLWSRPLWMRSIGKVNLSVATVQRAQGVAVDGTRLYDERTLNWLALYFGWSTIVLALLGYVILLNRAVRRSELVVLAPLLMGLSMSALYLWTSQITPDQPWAIRRYVPVVLPTLILAACVLLQVVRNRWQRWGVLGAGAGVLALIAVPSIISLPVLGVREEVPQRAQVAAICSAVGRDGAVLMIDESSRASYAQTMRSYCGVPATALLNVTLSQLSQVNAAVTASGRHLVVMAAQASSYPGEFASALSPFSSIQMSRWPSLINTVPKSESRTTINVYLMNLDSSENLVPMLRR